MARTTKAIATTEEVVEKIPEVVTKQESSSVDYSTLLKMIESQQELINSLKNEIEKNKSTQGINQLPTTNSNLTYDPNRLVAVVSMYDGESLTLKTGNNGEIMTFYGFGDKQYVRYEVASNMARMNRGFASKGYFIFEDADLIRDFGLTKDYDKFVDKKTFERIDEIDVDSLKALYNRVNDSFKNMIVEKFVNGYVEGKKGFRDSEKIEVLSEASGKDVQYTIEELQKAKRHNK